MCVASTSVASLFLPMGKAVHLFFGVPLELNKLSQCCIGASSTKVELLQAVKFIISDEVLM